MQETVKSMEKNDRGNTVTSDGVHMNSAGNMMMAKGVLKAMGMSKADLEAAEKEWDNIPNTNNVRVSVGLSHAEMRVLNKAAKEQGKSVQQLFSEAAEAKKKELLAK